MCDLLNLPGHQPYLPLYLLQEPSARRLHGPAVQSSYLLQHRAYRVVALAASSQQLTLPLPAVLRQVLSHRAGSVTCTGHELIHEPSCAPPDTLDHEAARLGLHGVSVVCSTASAISTLIPLSRPSSCVTREILTISNPTTITYNYNAPCIFLGSPLLPPCSTATPVDPLLLFSGCDPEGTGTWQRFPLGRKEQGSGLRLALCSVGGTVLAEPFDSHFHFHLGQTE